MILERGISVEPSTIYRRVQKYAPILEKKSRIHLKKSSDSYRAINDLQYMKPLLKECKLRQVKYLYNCIESDHRFLKRQCQYKQRFGNWDSAANTIVDNEIIHMIKKGQIKHVVEADVIAQNRFIDNLFAEAA